MKTMKIEPMRNWGLGLEDFIIISGPCSAETEDQVHQTIQGVATQGVDVLRAGIWKPRTRPNSFEGIGSEGLVWLKAAGKAVNKPVSVEVANVKHVYEALRVGVDILWLGARTTVNPFAVQEIADALKGVDVPVMIKNPVNPDLELWIGAIERIYGAGITKIAAVHRGFSVSGDHGYRNKPLWEMPIELRRRIPDLPIICDPSHICGTRTTLSKVSQKALDLNFNGLMIEAHINPDEAWSDAKQQVTPERLGEILRGLVHRKEESDDPGFRGNLEHLREMIDDLDRQIIHVLGERMKISEQIGQFKKANNITILQSARWDEIFRERLAFAAAKGVSPDVMKAILQMIHKESIRHQELVMNESEVLEND